MLDDLGSDGILLGVAVNQREFIARFDGLVLLELDQATQGERVAFRDRLFREQIEEGLPVDQAQMREHGAARVDATQSTGGVADAVISALSIRSRWCHESSSETVHGRPLTLVSAPRCGQPRRG